MRLRPLIGPIVLMVLSAPAGASGSPTGVWVSGNANSKVERIHISGAPFSYTAMIDFRCFTGLCSTLQGLFEDDSQHPPIFSAPLEGIGPAPVLALRWQAGPPCNRPRSTDNPLAYWATATLSKSGSTQLHAAGSSWCLHSPARPQGPASKSPH
jgi:hypothetical protein